MEARLKHVVAANKTGYLVFDDMGEKPSLLRSIQGGHTTDVSIVMYSFFFSLVVTGSVEGELAVWDYESSHLEAYLTGHTDQVTGIYFLEP
jgi:WD40 repeat protein